MNPLYCPPMGFLQDNKFKIRKAFAKAGICAATAVNITNAFNMNALVANIVLPLALISLSALAYIEYKQPPPEIDEPDAPPPPPAAYEITRRFAVMSGVNVPEIYPSRENFGIYKDEALFISPLEDERQLGGAIGHEIAHAKNRSHFHGPIQKLVRDFNNESLAVQAMYTGAYGMMIADYSSLRTLPLSIAASGATYLLTKYYSRQDEFEADRESAQMNGTGIHLVALLRSLQPFEFRPTGYVERLLKLLTAEHPPINIRARELTGWEERSKRRPSPPAAA